MFGYVYKTTNNLSGKIYIGQHRGNFDERYKGSGLLIKKAIKKYGKENFTVEMILPCISLIEMNYAEIYFIKKYNSLDLKIGYNISLGGSAPSVPYTEERRKKLSNSHKGKKLSEKTKKKLSELNKGKKLTEETRKKMSIARKGVKQGKRSEEARKKIAKRNQEVHCGKIPWNKGLKMNDEYRDKLSKAHKGKKWSEKRRLAQNKK